MCAVFLGDVRASLLGPRSDASVSGISPAEKAKASAVLSQVCSLLFPPRDS